MNNQLAVEALTDEQILKLAHKIALKCFDIYFPLNETTIAFARALLAEPQPITAEPKTPLGLPSTAPAGTEAIRATTKEQQQ